jgi:hypothetical protein
MHNLSYFRWSFASTVTGLILAYYLGGWPALLTVAALAMLEISLSFDNAVVNAKQLMQMSEVWRQRFLTWGMLIAVFGMRFVFPIVIVSIIGGGE